MLDQSIAQLFMSRFIMYSFPTFQFVREAYNWRDIARRTEVVYDRIMSRESRRRDLGERLARLWDRGRLAGPLMAVFFLLCHYWIKALDFLDDFGRT